MIKRKYFDGNTCKDCHISCDECNGPDFDNCISCADSAILLSNGRKNDIPTSSKCPCDTGTLNLIILPHEMNFTS